MESMGSFGERLKRERQMRGISLEEISASTKIGTRSLQALEDEDFNKLPGGIFNRGFIRSYARFLGLDEEQLVADYLEAESGQRKSVSAHGPGAARVPVETTEGRGESRRGESSGETHQAADVLPPASSPAAPSTTSSSSKIRSTVLAGVLVLAVLVWIGWRWYSSTSASETTVSDSVPRPSPDSASGKGGALGKSNTEAPVDHRASSGSTGLSAAGSSIGGDSPLQRAVEATAAETAPSSSPIKAPIKPVASSSPPSKPLTSNAAPRVRPSPVVPSSASAARSPKARPNSKPSGGGVNLAVAATEDSWVSIAVDGKVNTETVLKPGEQRFVFAQDSIRIRTNNAGGLAISLNGKKLPPVGEEKESKTLTFTDKGQR